VRSLSLGASSLHGEGGATTMYKAVQMPNLDQLFYFVLQGLAFLDQMIGGILMIPTLLAMVGTIRT